MTHEAPAMYFHWDGESLVPKHPRIADKYLTVGQDYRMVEEHERSMASHGHEFAWLAEAWQQLPEQYADIAPTPEHLRKRALIEAGFYDETIIDAGSTEAAERVASYIRKREPFSLVIVRAQFVIERAAKSQSRRAMNKKDFEASKQAILEVVSNMIGISPDTLVSRAGQAA